MIRRLALLPILAALALVFVAASDARVAHADPRDFTLINANPSVTLTEVYVGPSSSSDWGDDVLGQDVLLPGESVFIYFTRFTPDNCLYDIRVVYVGGGEGVLYDVNLCEIDTVTFR